MVAGDRPTSPRQMQMRRSQANKVSLLEKRSQLNWRISCLDVSEKESRVDGDWCRASVVYKSEVQE